MPAFAGGTLAAAQRRRCNTARLIYGRYLPYLINRAGVRLAVGFAREIRHHGVALQEWRALAAGRRAQRLAGLGLTPTRRSLDLAAAGAAHGATWLVRLCADGDKREPSRQPLRQAYHPRDHPDAQRYEHVALAGLSAREARALKRLLLRVYANSMGLPAAPVVRKRRRRRLRKEE